MAKTKSAETAKVVLRRPKRRPHQHSKHLGDRKPYRGQGR